MTRPVAANVIPTQDSTGSTATFRHDQLVAMTGRYRVCTLGNLGTLSARHRYGGRQRHDLVCGCLPTIRRHLYGHRRSQRRHGRNTRSSSRSTTRPALYSPTRLLPGPTWRPPTCSRKRHGDLHDVGRPVLDSCQTNGANANIRTIATATWIDVLTNNVAGTRHAACPHPGDDLRRRQGTDRVPVLTTRQGRTINSGASAPIFF
jgi:hypothetical protein